MGNDISRKSDFSDCDSDISRMSDNSALSNSDTGDSGDSGDTGDGNGIMFPVWPLAAGGVQTLQIIAAVRDDWHGYINSNSY